jgi:hypothetical protein
MDYGKNNCRDSAILHIRVVAREKNIMIDNLGLEVTVDGRKLTRVDVPTIRRSIALAMKQLGIPNAQACEVLGVHRDTYRKIAASEGRKAPEVIGVVFGQGDWTPETQDQDPATCDRCRGIKRGSRLYCAACHSTGFERELENERIDDIFAEASEMEAESRDKKAKRRTRKLK